MQGNVGAAFIKMFIRFDRFVYCRCFQRYDILIEAQVVEDFRFAQSGLRKSFRVRYGAALNAFGNIFRKTSRINTDSYCPAFRLARIDNFFYALF